MERRLVPAVSAFADAFGYSRAVRAGRHVFVAGTAPIMADGGDPPPDAYPQARRCLEIVLDALAEVGASARDVVRTRLYLTSAADAAAVGHAHGDVFGTVRPVTTGVVVSALFDPRWRVEIEADALLSE